MGVMKKSWKYNNILLPHIQLTKQKKNNNIKKTINIIAAGISGILEELKWR
jgi:hypothetical protein